MSYEHSSESAQNDAMQRYYQLQSKIYDATRWSFLFGRKQIIRDIPLDRQGAWNILEVGCGTGYNLERLARQFPQARLTGMDVSSDMVELSRKKMQPFGKRAEVLAQPYLKGDESRLQSLDLVLFSYSLTMINPQWSELILQAKEDLKPGGLIAVTDFYDSRRPWFKKHMGANHVRMDSHLHPLLRHEFKPIQDEIKSAYFGVWEYFIFIGQKS
jgi:S-adenosylmethionine-diacylgycerolhomoserine-N-methlytransferase